MESPHNRHLLFIAGMHRSGTSALCAALQTCGATFGDELIGAMDGVNERGFWESEAVVDINESLLAAAGFTWYGVDSTVLAIDWSDTVFDTQRATTRQLLEAGFGDGPLEVVKDPRFCLTLPFWLELAAQLGLQVSIGSVLRSPSEVSQSIARRDGFPLDYALRIAQLYLAGIARHESAGLLLVNYRDLLADPATALESWIRALPLSAEPAALGSALEDGLRHFHDDDYPGEGDAGCAALAQALARQIESGFQAESTLSGLAHSFVLRGQELTRIGQEHSHALGVVAARDQQLREMAEQGEALASQLEATHEKLALTSDELQRMGGLHSEALATLDERDAQIAGLDHRLQALGAEHSVALDTLRERDAWLESANAELSTVNAELSTVNAELSTVSMQLKAMQARLAAVTAIPLVGRIIRVIWNRASS